MRKISRAGMALRQAVGNFVSGPDGITGAALIEFTVFAPIVLVLIIGLIDFGLYTYRMSEVQNAAQAGIQYVIQRGNFDAAKISAAVTNSTCYPSTSCGTFTSTISASPAPSRFCGCPSTTGVTQIAAGACASGALCADGSSAGTYVTVQAQATFDTALPTTLSPSPWILTFASISGCPGGANMICAKSTVRLP